MSAETHHSPQRPKDADSKDGKKEFDWFDRPESRRLLWRLLYGACVLSLLAEIPLIIAHKRHGHFGDHSIDGWWFFYAALGFVGCALMILAAKGCGFLLKKPTDFYGDDSAAAADQESLPEDIDESLR